MIAIDSGRIEAMAEQMRSVVSRMQSNQAAQSVEPTAMGPNSGLDFAKALKSHLDSVNQLQSRASDLKERFSIGDNSVSLSDVMIASQKANITLQTTVQVRNKLVSAYHDIMNMQI